MLPSVSLYAANVGEGIKYYEIRNLDGGRGGLAPYVEDAVLDVAAERADVFPLNGLMLCSRVHLFCCRGHRGNCELQGRRFFTSSRDPGDILAFKMNRCMVLRRVTRRTITTPHLSHEILQG